MLVETLPGEERAAAQSVRGAVANLHPDRISQASQVLVQDAQPFRHGFGFGLAALTLPRLSVPASQAGVELRYPAEWIPVYEELAPQSRLHLLGLGELLTLLAGVALAERLLALGAVSARRRWLLALSLGLAAAFAPALRVGALGVLALAWLAIGVALVLARLTGAMRGLMVLGP